MGRYYKYILNEQVERVWHELIWIKTGISGGLLWTSRFHKMRGLSWLADQSSASQEGLWSTELGNTVIPKLKSVCQSCTTGNFKIPYSWMIMIMNLMKKYMWVCKVDNTDLGSCSMAQFGISYVEPLDSTSTGQGLSSLGAPNSMKMLHNTSLLNHRPP